MYYIHPAGNAAPGPPREVILFASSRSRLVLDIDQQTSNMWLADVDGRETGA